MRGLLWTLVGLAAASWIARLPASPLGVARATICGVHPGMTRAEVERTLRPGSLPLPRFSHLEFPYDNYGEMYHSEADVVRICFSQDRVYRAWGTQAAYDGRALRFNDDPDSFFSVFRQQSKRQASVGAECQLDDGTRLRWYIRKGIAIYGLGTRFRDEEPYWCL